MNLTQANKQDDNFLNLLHGSPIALEVKDHLENTL